jgi:hypothetical protein
MAIRDIAKDDVNLKEKDYIMEKILNREEIKKLTPTERAAMIAALYGDTEDEIKSIQSKLSSKVRKGQRRTEQENAAIRLRREKYFAKGVEKAISFSIPQLLAVSHVFAFNATSDNDKTAMSKAFSKDVQYAPLAMVDVNAEGQEVIVYDTLHRLSISQSVHAKLVEVPKDSQPSWKTFLSTNKLASQGSNGITTGQAYLVNEKVSKAGEILSLTLDRPVTKLEKK